MHFRCHPRIICKDLKTFQIQKLYSTEQSKKSGEIMKLMDLLLIYVCLTSPSPDNPIRRQASLVFCGRMTWRVLVEHYTTYEVPGLWRKSQVNLWIWLFYTKVRGNVRALVWLDSAKTRGPEFHTSVTSDISHHRLYLSGVGGLEVVCWPLVPKFAGLNPAEVVGFLGRKNPQHAFLRRGSKSVGPMS
jgi:hypothetical protein